MSHKWPEGWTDPQTGERLTTMGKYREGPYAKPLGCYEYDENAELKCWNCGWRGSAGEGSRETHNEVFDVSCPRCETMLLIVSTVVGPEEIRKAAAAGHPGAQRTLAEMEKMEARWEREKELKLKRADQLPDLEGDNLVFKWDKLELEPGETWVVIHLGDQTVWKELEPFADEWKRFNTVRWMLKTRYGSRFKSLTPEPEKGEWADVPD